MGASAGRRLAAPCKQAPPAAWEQAHHEDEAGQAAQRAQRGQPCPADLAVAEVQVLQAGAGRQLVQALQGGRGGRAGEGVKLEAAARWVLWWHARPALAPPPHRPCPPAAAAPRPTWSVMRLHLRSVSAARRGRRATQPRPASCTSPQNDRSSLVSEGASPSSASSFRRMFLHAGAQAGGGGGLTTGAAGRAEDAWWRCTRKQQAAAVAGSPACMGAALAGRVSARWQEQPKAAAAAGTGKCSSPAEVQLLQLRQGAQLAHACGRHPLALAHIQLPQLAAVLRHHSHHSVRGALAPACGTRSKAAARRSSQRPAHMARQPGHGGAWTAELDRKAGRQAPRAPAPAPTDVEHAQGGHLLQQRAQPRRRVAPARVAQVQGGEGAAQAGQVAQPLVAHRLACARRGSGAGGGRGRGRSRRAARPLARWARGALRKAVQAGGAGQQPSHPKAHPTQTAPGS